MTDDLRHRFQFAVSLTIAGLMADLGYFAIEVAARFSLDHRWPEAAAFFTQGVVATVLGVTSALKRVKREEGRG